MWCRFQCWIVHQASAFFLKVFFALMKSPGIDFEKKKNLPFLLCIFQFQFFYILRYELYKFVLQKFLQGVQYGKMPLELNNYCYSNITLYSFSLLSVRNSKHIFVQDSCNTSPNSPHIQHNQIIMFILSYVLNPYGIHCMGIYIWCREILYEYAKQSLMNRDCKCNYTTNFWFSF